MIFIFGLAWPAWSVWRSRFVWGSRCS